MKRTKQTADTRQSAGKASNNNDANRKLGQLEKEADNERTRKPGSQSNSSDRHNTGRGGGK